MKIKESESKSNNNKNKSSDQSILCTIINILILEAPKSKTTSGNMFTDSLTLILFNEN